MHNPDSIDKNNQMYFHVDFVAPGKHVFFVKHDPDEIHSDGEDGQASKKLSDFFREKMSPNKRRKAP